ncbi:MAG: cupin domain-containing protein [Tatlockia sp.]|nr:cupin domain-containing protein [Tatlockia sp.]
MINFKELSQSEFLTNYWQKRPLVIRKALPDFVNPLSPDELAGLAMEEEIESRIVIETVNKYPYWHLKRGPFLEKDFAKLPKTHWTLLVQGVDRFIPEVASMFNYFNFIPQWRRDDIMISYAVEQGSVGPHYDNYDVFLYQAKGQRKWSLTTKNCNETNYLKDIDLRIMQDFEVEEEYILEEGDLLYLPPHVGHYGKAISAECMTYSFGYRSYQAQELLESFTEYMAEQQQTNLLYKDPNWSSLNNNGELPKQAWLNAKILIQELLDDETRFKTWFGCFATQLDQQAETLLPLIDEEKTKLTEFMSDLVKSSGFRRNPLCRFAYEVYEDPSEVALFINGCQWDTDKVSIELIKLVANSAVLLNETIADFLNKKEDQQFLYDLWLLQWLEFNEEMNF